MARVLSCAVLLLALPAVTAGQNPGSAPAAVSEFSAASVRPNTMGGNNASFQIFPGGQFRATNATVRQLVQAAFDFQIERFQLVGGPSWIDADRFDVQATPVDNAAPTGAEPRIATQEEIARRVQALLADRFKLAIRREMRDMPRFDLVVAKGGARLARNTGTCVQPAAQQAEGETRPRCAISYAPDAGDLQRMVGTGVTMATLARRRRTWSTRWLWTKRD